jgi:microsomal epoxide hydrolase
MAYVMNEVMVSLNLTGYISHGGDIGSFLARICAVRYDACRAMNLNFYLMAAEPTNLPADAVVTDEEKKNLKRLADFGTYGNAYAKEHGTKGGTIGLVLATNPLALLAWIGEKFQEWTDVTPDLKDIVDSVTLYWLTETFPRCIYPYIDFFGRGDESTVFHPHPDYYCKKPMGFSYFPMELGPIPIAWAKTTGNLIWWKSHTSVGGPLLWYFGLGPSCLRVYYTFQHSSVAILTG